jgi:predicted nucleotidyltransferase
MGRQLVASIEEIQRKALPVLTRYGVKRAALFGSIVRGEARARSDVDLLVDMDRPIGLFRFVGLKQDLEKALGRKVDVVEYGAIKPVLRDRILGEQVPILER